MPQGEDALPAGRGFAQGNRWYNEYPGSFACDDGEEEPAPGQEAEPGESGGRQKKIGFNKNKFPAGSKVKADYF